MTKLRRYWGVPLIGLGLVFLLLALIIFFTTEPAYAQCGASASSCKNCHEVNAKHPVNDSGQWHIKHAFGDFCSFCHGGDVQATDKELAHKAMIYPLADPKTSCQTCHPTDTMERAKVYAVVLGVDLKGVDSGSNSNKPSGGNSDPKTDASKAELKPIDPPGEKNATGALIDYNRRYDVEVLGILDSSRTGNLILFISAVVITLLGAFLLWRFEHLGQALRKAAAVPEWVALAERQSYSGTALQLETPMSRSASDTTPIQLRIPESTSVELPIEAQKLDAQAQDALRKLLSDPRHGEAILRALSHLDPSLIDSLQSLEKQDRALLLAIVEKLGALRS